MPWGPGRLLIRADDPNLTPYAGLVIVGELTRRTRLVEIVDAELARPVPRSRPARLQESKRRLEEEHQVHCQANEAL